MLEMLETKLCLMADKPVILIRPSFGLQSDSWRGLLSVHTESFPVQFQVVSDGQATVFTVDDVKATKLLKEQLIGPQFIITLKGPKDYENPPEVDTTLDNS